MDKETWEMGARAVNAIKDNICRYGVDDAEAQLNSYRELSLSGRIKRMNELVRMSSMFPSFYKAVKAIAHYHAENDDSPEVIPPALGKWAIGVYTKWIDRPKCDPENLRLIGNRDTAIIHSMIILVELEGWSALQAELLISKIFGKPSPDEAGKTLDPAQKTVEYIWGEAKKNRDNPAMPEYMRFFTKPTSDDRKEWYQSWKKRAFLY